MITPLQLMTCVQCCIHVRDNIMYICINPRWFTKSQFFLRAFTVLFCSSLEHTNKKLWNYHKIWSTGFVYMDSFSIETWVFCACTTFLWLNATFMNHAGVRDRGWMLGVQRMHPVCSNRSTLVGVGKWSFDFVKQSQNLNFRMGRIGKN